MKNQRLDHDTNSAFAELGLTPTATEHEVKTAWRRLVSQWHPDRNASAAAVARMQRINRAFKAIRQGGFGVPPTPPGAAPSATEPAAAAQRQRGFSGEAPPVDEATRGNSEQPSSASARSTRTIHRKLKLTLEDAAAGCTRSLSGRITGACAECDGAGYQVLGGHCSQCKGSGAVRNSTWFGWVGTSSECEACHGGGIARRTCPSCSGGGQAEAAEYGVAVRIPAGVRDGDLLRVDCRRLKTNATLGEFKLRIEIQAHRFLRLDDDGTIHCEMPVDGFAWTGNRTVEVPTLGGLHSLRLDRDRLTYRLQGRGFPIERRGRLGDQLITVEPVFPKVLNTDQEILLDQLIASTSGPDATDGDERLRSWNRMLRRRRS